MLEKHTSAWSQTVALLDDASAQQVVDEATRIARRRPAKTIWNDHAALMVSVIECPTPRTATVLSGKRIKPGDFIYRPVTCQPPPGNAGAMIIATELVPCVTPSQS